MCIDRTALDIAGMCYTLLLVLLDRVGRVACKQLEDAAQLSMGCCVDHLMV